MPQPVSYNPGTPVSGSIQENNISYVVDGQNRNYRGGFGGLSWMSEVPAENNVIFIGNSVSLGRGPADIPLFYPAYNTSQANIVYAANTLPGSPRNFTTSASAYNWAVTNNFFINNSNNPIPRINGDSLGLYIDANQPSSYPQTGTSWYDLSGRNTNGTLTNGPSWNSNGWFTFDGVDDYVNFGTTSGGIGGSSEATMELLINMTFPQALQQIFGFRDNSGFDFFFLAFSGGGSEFRARNSAGTFYDLNPSVSSYAGKWTQINFSVGPSGRRVYANGNLIDSNPTWTGNFGSTSPLSLGNYQIGNIWFATGDAANAKLYRKELSQAEIKQNYFQSNIVTSNMIYAIDASNLVSYPRSGTTTYPLTGSQTGTLTNGVGYSNSNGGIWSFDGIDDYINLNTDPWTANAFGDDSISIWFKFSSAGVILGQNMNAPFGASGWVPAIYIDTSYQLRTSVFWGGSTGNQTVSPSALLTNTWYNVTVTNEGGTQRTYLNGELIGTLSKTQTSYAGVYYYTLGAARWNGWSGVSGDIGYLQGQIANLYYYNKTLTPSEVQQNYEATKYKFQGQQIVTNGLVLNLDAANKDSYPGTGTTWYDLSGNGNNGIINSGEFVPNSFDGYLGNLNNQSNFFYITIPNSTSISNTLSVTTGGWTIEEIIWTNSTNYPEADAGSVFSNPAYGPGATGFDWNHGFDITSFQFGQSSNSATGYEDTVSISSIPSQYTQFNTWRIRTMIWDRSNNTVSLYINGVYIGGGSTPNTAGQPIYDGGGGDVGTLYGWKFYGRRGAFKIWNKVLSQSEITQNYNAQKTRFGL